MFIINVCINCTNNISTIRIDVDSNTNDNNIEIITIMINPIVLGRSRIFSQASLLKGGCPLRLICPFTFPQQKEMLLLHDYFPPNKINVIFPQQSNIFTG